MKSHPCPSTGKTKGRCPGYVVDHVKPLCAGGADRPSNMQWQTVKEAKKKDRLEAAECRRLKELAAASEAAAYPILIHFATATPKSARTMFAPVPTSNVPT
jgi:hypothetical protein